VRVLFAYNRFESFGIEVLSSFLKSHGHDTDLLFDPQLFNDGYVDIPPLARLFDHRKRLLKKIEETKPDLMAVGVITDNYQWALNLARSAKERLSVPIVFGGAHCTAVPEEVISHDCVDFVIVGEAEYALLELVEALEKGEDYSRIKNLVFEKDGRVVANEVRNLVEDLDELPLPDKDLFYDVIPYARRTYSLMTSRGCPYSCTYCFNNVYRRIYKNKGRYLRRRSVDNVIEELKVMKERYGCRFVAIHDDVFMTDDAWIAEFCEKYKSAIGVPFRCIGHVNYMNESNIRMLKDAGCEIIQIGVQTTCEHTRRNVIHRYETNEVIARASRIVKEAKIRLELDHILGFPYEGEKEHVEAARFYNEIRPDIINCYWLACLPKTDIIKHMIDDGRLSEEDVEGIEKGLDKSFVLGGSVRDVRNLRKFSSLFSLIPVLPRRVIDTVIRRRLYRLTNFGNTFMASMRVIKSLFWRDIRLLEFISFYKRYMIRKILSKG
jgi:radical SAM superfamily enzyme YgiQ (UPF0313 family)